MAQTPSADRAVSASIAVVLMIAITVLLGILAATGVFSQLDPYGVSEPQVETAYFYTEDHEASELDSFGLSGNAYGDGWATIQRESAANALNAEQLTIEVGGTSYSWANKKTPYNVGDKVGVGDSINVWAERGDTVLITWETADGEESFVLGSYTIPEAGPDSSGGGVPDADEDCEWVENQLGPAPYSGDLTVDGIVVECDLDAYDVTNLDIVNNGAVIGEIETDEDVTVDNGATYDGDIVADGDDVDLSSGSTVNGDVFARGDVSLDTGSSIDGTVDADGQVNVDGSSRIKNDVTADGDVDINDQSEVSGAIDTTGGINVDDSSVVTGAVTVEGEVQINGGSTVQNDVESTNDGDISVTSSTVLGYVATDGEEVNVDDSTIQDDVYKGEDFSCVSSTIAGDDCSAYTPKNYPPP